jgi:ribosomal protein S17E|tara:strand:- start:2380 stop:2748 length:369 start_codon:yes stop_codon:yes gene_type:complete
MYKEKTNELVSDLSEEFLTLLEVITDDYSPRIDSDNQQYITNYIKIQKKQLENTFAGILSHVKKDKVEKGKLILTFDNKQNYNLFLEKWYGDQKVKHREEMKEYITEIYNDSLIIALTKPID